MRKCEEYQFKKPKANTEPIFGYHISNTDKNFIIKIKKRVYSRHFSFRRDP